MAEKYISSAKVVDGVLILSMPDAISPVVWQMELGQSKSSALEIKNSDSGEFILTLKTPRQDVLDIARYASKDIAIKALLVTSQALEKAQGQLKSAPQNNQHSPLYPVPAISHYQSEYGFWTFFKKTLSFLAKIMGGIIIIVVVFFLITKIFFANPSGVTAPSESKPMSADEFLQNN